MKLPWGIFRKSDFRRVRAANLQSSGCAAFAAFPTYALAFCEEAVFPIAEHLGRIFCYLFFKRPGFLFGHSRHNLSLHIKRGNGDFFPHQFADDLRLGTVSNGGLETELFDYIRVKLA
jgi:hypothetical protein